MISLYSTTRDSNSRAIFTMLAKKGTSLGPVGLAWMCATRATTDELELLRDIQACMGKEWSACVTWDLLTTGSSYIVPCGIISDMFCIQGNDLVVSNVWTENQATIAFVIMRSLCGKDVAGIIARKVARMHLDDFAWLRTLNHGMFAALPRLRERMVSFGWIR